MMGNSVKPDLPSLTLENLCFSSHDGPFFGLSPCSYYSQLACVFMYSNEMVIDLPGNLCGLILLIITQNKGSFISDLVFG